MLFAHRRANTPVTGLAVLAAVLLSAPSSALAQDRVDYGLTSGLYEIKRGMFPAVGAAGPYGMQFRGGANSPLFWRIVDGVSCRTLRSTDVRYPPRGDHRCLRVEVSLDREPPRYFDNQRYRTRSRSSVDSYVATRRQTWFYGTQMPPLWQPSASRTPIAYGYDRELIDANRACARNSS